MKKSEKASTTKYISKVKVIGFDNRLMKRNKKAKGDYRFDSMEKKNGVITY